jgi:hypothetical protein
MRTKDKWDAINKRKSKRYSKVGRHFEQVEMKKILNDMKKNDQLSDFKISEPLSDNDQKGIDFTVYKKVGSEVQKRYFGVSISYRSKQNSRIKYPDIKQFHFPLNTKVETIRKRILELFD